MQDGQGAEKRRKRSVPVWEYKEGVGEKGRNEVG